MSIVTDEELVSVFGGKTLREALRDQQARELTGYSYNELVELVKDEENEDMLDLEDLENVDKSVNLLGHLFVYFAKTARTPAPQDGSETNEAIPNNLLAHPEGINDVKNKTISS